jgi:hypothetical protein
MFGKKSKSAKTKVTRGDQLRSDFTSVTGLFKSHPFISIKETFGVPAEKYRILYKIDGLQQVGKTKEAKNEHIVEILLPPGYPGSAPLCKAVSPVFHPNFSADEIDIKEHWAPGMPLADLIVRIGEMIAFQKYSTEHPVNTEAAKWADRNSSMLPLSRADLHVLPAEPAKVQTSAVAPEKKKSQPPSPEETSVSEIVIQEQDADTDVDAAPGPEDGRKTEGIIISTDTAQLAVEPAPAERPTLTIATDPVKPPVQESSPAPQDEKPAEIPAVTPVAGDAADREKTPEQKPAAQPMVLFQFFYCPYCGNKNNKDANFCMNCGARIKPLKKRNVAKILYVIAMTVIPVVILAAGVTTIILHVFDHAGKEAVSTPALPALPEKEKPAAVPQEATAAHQQEVKAPAPAITSETIERKMTKTQEPAVQKTPGVFTPSPTHLTEQQKSEKIAGLLQNARLYMNIGSYDDAIKRYKEVLKINPTNYEASMGLDSAQEARVKAPPRPAAPSQPEE